MSAKVRKNIHWLKVLRQCTPKQRKMILKMADPSLVKSLCECIHNILTKNVPISSSQERKLCRHKNCLRKLVDKKKPIKSKHKLLIQTGGAILPIILPSILAVLASLLK